jgi:hypothetical protein
MLAPLLVSVPEKVVCVCSIVYLAFAQHHGIKVPAALCEGVAGHVCILLLHLPPLLFPPFLLSLHLLCVLL